MGYSGIHRPSILGRIGGVISFIVEVGILWWLIWRVVPQIRTFDGFLWSTVGLVLSLAIAVTLHEAGHLVVGLAVGEPVRKIRVGSGPTVVGFRVKNLAVQICLNPLGGGAVYFSEVDAVPGQMRLASLAAGPGMNLLNAAYGLALYDLGYTWLGAFVLANVICLVSSAMPSTTTEGGRQHKSDGMQILDLLLKPSVQRTHFEGAEMTDDARAVLVRAVEDAELSGAQEVTDEALLRALNQDTTVGQLFASTGLSQRIEAPKNAETDELTIPHWSTTTNTALETAFRKGRDMGVSRPNAAGLCLGLLSVDCPASRLMKEAGITEEAVRKLAALTTDDEEAQRRERVLSPDLALERWGTAADKALAYAIRIAQADFAEYVGTQHIVAALVADPSCRAAQALTRLRFVLVANPKQSDSPAHERSSEPPILSPQTALAVAGAIWRTGPTYPTGTAELCLGIVDQSAGIGAQILLSAGVTSDALLKALRYTERESGEPAGCTAASRGMWNLRASARMGAGRWLEARADFLEADRTATTELEHAACRNNVAWVSLMSGDPSLRAEALELSRAALAFKPDQPAFRGTHAFALLETGSPAEAAAMLEENVAAQTRPRDKASDLCVFAMCEARLHQLDAAGKNLDAARAADPKCLLLSRAQAEIDKALSDLAVEPRQTARLPT